MAGALISFSSFATPSDRGAYGWRRSAAAVRDQAGLIPPHIDEVERAYWRLHAANNRELARSVRLYASVREAREHAVAVSAGLARVHATTYPVSSARSVGWYATIDGEPVMMCARWYQSSTLAAQSAARSIAVLASLAPTLRPRASLVP